MGLDPPDFDKANREKMARLEKLALSDYDVRLILGMCDIAFSEGLLEPEARKLCIRLRDEAQLNYKFIWEQ